MEHILTIPGKNTKCLVPDYLQHFSAEYIMNRFSFALNIQSNLYQAGNG